MNKKFSLGGHLSKITCNISLVITIIGLLVIITGTSYAVLRGNTSSSSEQIIRAGGVTLTLTENYESINKKIIVLEDADGLLQEDVYEFNIKNTGSIAARYDVKIINELSGENVLPLEYIKVGLEINGEEYGPFNLGEEEGIIDSGVIYKKEIINYSLRIWLDKDKEEEIKEIEGKMANLKIVVEAEQRVGNISGESKEFSYTGKAEEYIVPRDGWYYIEMAGGQGGTNGGLGAKISGYIELEAGEKLYFYVGGEGTGYNTNCRTSGYEFNGGGIAKPASNGVCGSTGGGATDVRLVGGSWDNTSSLISRIMVAGGGSGGASSNSLYVQGDGGTLHGIQAITSTSSYNQYIGHPGTQISGGSAPIKYSGAQSNGEAGSFGKGGSGGASRSTATEGGGAGGGSGYYGASGASGLNNGTFLSSGGSSYISGYAGVNSVEESTTITHTNNTLHYSGKYFIGGQMVTGANSGDGYAKIVYVDTKPKKKNTNLNNVRYIKDCSSYNTYNDGNYWIEIQAIVDGVNIAKGKTVTGTTPATSVYPYSRITDGDITYTNYATPSSATPVTKCVTVDLGSTYDLDEVAVWNYFGNPRSFYDNIVSVSSDNNSWKEVINEATIQTSNGRRINAYTDTYNGYVQDDLILWYDGYANTGEARDNTTTTWRDLSGNNNDGTLTGGTWYRNYLSFDGVNDYIKTSSAVNYNNSKAFTLQFIGTVSKTDLGIIFESSEDSNQNDGSYYIDTNEFGTNDLTLAMKYPSSNLKNHKMVDNILEDTTASYTIIFDSTRSYNNYILIYKNSELYQVVPGGVSNTDGNLSNKTLSNYIFYIASRAGTSFFTEMKLNSLRIYNKALTEEEVLHNYLYDKQTFNLE